MARKAKAAPVEPKQKTIKKVTKLATSLVLIKSLDPKDPDTKYFGNEPEFTVQPDNRFTALAKAFTWYNRFYARKDAKEALAHYLDQNDRAVDAKTIRKVDDNELIPTICWLSRMKLRGLELNEQEQATLDREISRLIKAVHKPEVKISATGKNAVIKKESVKPNVQDIMRQRTREAGGELEGLFDDFITEGASAKFVPKVIDEVQRKNILPQHISILTEVWKKKQDEFETLLKGKDSQLIEGYRHLTKVQIKNIIKFIEQVISDLNSYVSVKKAAKAPRARKAIPVEKQVAKLKYLKEFKDPATKLDLVSLHPVKLHGATEAWVYDTAKRKLHHYVADDYSKTFSVKGNTLLGFCTKQSEVKTLRKPAEQIKEIVGSKPAARKYFKDIKAVSVVPNGRFNETMIILKAF